ncbi:unnamed protein product [Miscanthus lutarioriparius]|uniref:Uncharacterized protein n=1 Tax=Miscanthus lutarioriparius TaxID=422564 RepID=A0A811S187_9POAL|nr:unnamed protein product [Miscanthus lutarioriparius]
MDGGLLGREGGILLHGGVDGDLLCPERVVTFYAPGGDLLGPCGGILHCGGISTKGGGWLGREGGTLPRGSRSPTPSGGIATMEGGFLGPIGGIKHGGGIATKEGGWLGRRVVLSPWRQIPNHARWHCRVIVWAVHPPPSSKSVVDSVIATTTTIGDVVAPMILFLLLAMASL